MRNGPAAGAASEEITAESLAGECSESKRNAPSRQQRWTARNPKAAWAHSCLRSAIRRGLIERQPCEVCGAEPADGHHDDYSKPMAVRWLCRKHHKAAHAKAAKADG